MTIQLGNIILDDDLRLYGLEEAEDIQVSEMTSFDGTSDFLTMPRGTSRPLSLVASLDGEDLNGAFLVSQINAIKSIIQAGQPTTLIHPRGTFSVLVRRIEGFVNVDDLVDVADDDWCVATIIMSEV